VDAGSLETHRPLHNFLESRYDNNVAEVASPFPHAGKKGTAPAAPDPVDEIVDDENRPDK